MTKLSRNKFKQACKSLKDYPPEEESLGLEALRFRDWLDQQPLWIHKKGNEYYDMYSDYHSEIDLDLVVKERLEFWLRRQING